MFAKVIAGDFTFKDSVANVSAEAKDLITKLLNPDPCKRLAMKDAMEHPWLSASHFNHQGSYLKDWSKFLAQEGFVLKPKAASDVNQNVVSKLKDISAQFPLSQLVQTSFEFDKLIGKYYSSKKPSSLKRKIGEDAPSVLNLCVAYKLFLHRELLSRSFSSYQIGLTNTKSLPTRHLGF